MRLKLIIVFSFILCNIYPSGIYKYRVYLKDKQGAVLSDDFVTEKSKERREIQNVVADFSDLPVSDIYIRDLSDKGYDIVTKSKWMNTVVVSSAKDDALTELKSLSYADSVDIVWCGNQTRTLQKKRISEVSAQTAGENIYPQNDTTYHLYMHNTHQLHEMGFTGKGITVADVDAGFQSVDNNPILNKNVLGAVDFVYETDNPYCDDKHGTNVLSVITAGGDSPIYGAAPDYHFCLLRSEFGDT